jgi:hypothetical protein
VQFEYDNTLHKVEGQLNILILLSWHGQFYTFNAYNFLLLYNMLLVLSKYQDFGYLHSITNL